MTSRRPSRKDMEKLCTGVGPEDGIDPRYLSKLADSQRINRKMLQLCSQVSQEM